MLSPGPHPLRFRPLLLLLRCCCCSHGAPSDNVYVYAALLTLIQRQGLQERAVEVWAAIKADGVQLSPHIFSSLFAACATSGGGTSNSGGGSGGGGGGGGGGSSGDAARPSPALVATAVEAAEAMQAAWRAQAGMGARGRWHER